MIYKRDTYLRGQTSRGNEVYPGPDILAHLDSEYNPQIQCTETTAQSPNRTAHSRRVKATNAIHNAGKTRATNTQHKAAPNGSGGFVKEAGLSPVKHGSALRQQTLQDKSRQAHAQPNAPQRHNQHAGETIPQIGNTHNTITVQRQKSAPTPTHAPAQQDMTVSKRAMDTQKASDKSGAEPNPPIKRRKSNAQHKRAANLHTRRRGASKGTQHTGTEQMTLPFGANGSIPSPDSPMRTEPADTLAAEQPPVAPPRQPEAAPANSRTSVKPTPAENGEITISTLNVAGSLRSSRTATGMPQVLEEFGSDFVILTETKMRTQSPSGRHLRDTTDSTVTAQAPTDSHPTRTLLARQAITLRAAKTTWQGASASSFAQT